MDQRIKSIVDEFMAAYPEASGLKRDELERIVSELSSLAPDAVPDAAFLTRLRNELIAGYAKRVNSAGAVSPNLKNRLIFSLI